MNALLLYLLKTVLCAALLYGYYFVALRNRQFHQWNRFYLLLIPPLSLLLPLLRFEIQRPAEAAPALPVRLLQVVSDGNAFVDATVPPSRGLDPNVLAYCIYTVVALGLLLHFARGIWALQRLARRYPARRVDDVDFIVAPVPGTPFSFFRRVFWNPAIDASSDKGRQILQHELVHVREGHSADKVLLQAVLVLCWFNPVFWLLRAELHLVHEFIADRQSVRGRDAGTLAALILQAAYPGQYGSLVNPFFHRAIKRRLYMLNQSQKARVQYFGRVAALPLLALVGFAFAVRAQKQTPVVTTTNPQKFTVVIDAGHGRMPDGSWSGASRNGVTEDQITLSVAQRVKALNTDPNLRIELTRSNDAVTDLHQRAAIAKQLGAQLFLSLHVDAAPGPNGTDGSQSGIRILLSRDSAKFTQSRVFGSLLARTLTEVYATSQKLEQRNGGVWVLDQSPCPAALVEMGNLENPKDRAFFSTSANQERLAHELLNAITDYRGVAQGAAQAQQTTAQNEPDTTQRAQLMAYLSGRLAELRRQPAKGAESKQLRQQIRVLEERLAALQNGQSADSYSVNEDGTVTVATAEGKQTMNAADAKRRGYLNDIAPNGNPAGKTTASEDIRSIDIGRGSDVTVNYNNGQQETVSSSDAVRSGLLNNVDGIVTKPNVVRSPEPAGTVSAQPIVVNLKSGDTLSLEVYKALPLQAILSPEGYTLESCTLSGDLKNGDIRDAPMTGGQISTAMRTIQAEAWSGQVITIDHRRVRTKDGELKKLPAIVFFIR